MQVAAEDKGIALSDVCLRMLAFKITSERSDGYLNSKHFPRVAVRFSSVVIRIHVVIVFHKPKCSSSSSVQFDWLV